MLNRSSLLWIAVILSATGIDLTVRFGGGFAAMDILPLEAVLFPLTGAVLLALFLRGSRGSGFGRKVRIVLIALFFLAGLRSGLWAMGMPVDRVNLVVLAVALLSWLVLRRSRGTRGKGAPEAAR